MSTSQKHKTIVVLLVFALAYALSGCSERSPAPAEEGQVAAQNPGQVQSSETTQQATEPTQPGATDFAPVDVELKNGGFAKSTPKSIHVPSGFIVVVRASADESGRYLLKVLSPTIAQSFKIKPGGVQRVTLDSMREGQQAKLMVGGQTVRIAADAEPGP